MKIFLILISFGIILTADTFIISTGGFSACENIKSKCSMYKSSTTQKDKLLYNFLKKEAPNINSVTMWITRDWEEYWYPVKDVNKFVKNGYTPVYIFYWFADEINKSFVDKNRKKYYKSLNKFILYLKHINGKKIVILNPEYNENGMEKSKKFDLLQVESILKIKEKVKNVLVGICPGDFGDYQTIWDNENWDMYQNSMHYSAKVSDFIAFQEMRALTKNKNNEIYNAPFRTVAFATYLHNKYKKPTYLAYLAISSYKNSKLQENVFKNFKLLLPIMKKSANLMGIGLFSYLDEPGHTGYFKEAEKYFGIKKANGQKKNSFKEFLEWE